MVKYMEKHPIDRYFTWKYNKEDLGMYRWSWEFHNSVNERLGKQVMTWDMALTLYTDIDTGVCAKDCGDGPPSVSEKKSEKKRSEIIYINPYNSLKKDRKH
jgi:hypothetical protein